ncbi:hypothetical protein FACS1894159_11140 [Bacteroidia bacterium]|nr:hypothetical protein FACS1894159_11140 [Bacteroidia bacterium]
MKKLFFISALTLGAALFSCNTDQTVVPAVDGSNLVIITASGNDTRTEMNGKVVIWAENDALGVLDDAGNSTAAPFALTSAHGAATADFSGTLASDDAVARTLYAVYPYHAANASPANAYQLTLPASQSGKPGDHLFMAASPVHISTAPSQTNIAFGFSHLMAVLDINVVGIPVGETVSSVTIRATNGSDTPFATTATVDLTAANPVASGFGANVGSLSVANAKRGNITASIVIFPTDFSASPAGLTIDVATNKQTYSFLKTVNKNFVAGSRNPTTVEIAPVTGSDGFEFLASETARPGVGDNLNVDVIPIRAELLKSTTDPTTYLYPLGGTGSVAGVQLRIWFVSKRGTAVGRMFALNNASGYTNGFKTDEVASICGDGSTLSGGNQSRSWDQNAFYFKNLSDAQLYNVSYTQYNFAANSRINFPTADSFTVPCYLTSYGADDPFPYDGATAPVHVSMAAMPPLFTPSDSETFRPGVGAYAAYDIVPVRGEFFVSAANPSPLYFTSAAGSGTNIFRMWTIQTKGAITATSGINILLPSVAGTYFKGSVLSDVTSILGAGSQIGAGNATAGQSIKQTRCYFPDPSDNDLYEVYYTQWNATGSECYVAASTGTYSVRFHIEPNSGTGGANIPAERLYNYCPVIVRVQQP